MRTARDLEGILERERTLLLKGEIDQLGRLVDLKTRLVGELERTGAPAKAAARIQRMAIENQGLFEAAIRGVRSATKVVIGARAKTYDRSGAVTELAGPSVRVEKNA